MSKHNLVVTVNGEQVELNFPIETVDPGITIPKQQTLWRIRNEIDAAAMRIFNVGNVQSPHQLYVERPVRLQGVNTLFQLTLEHQFGFWKGPKMVSFYVVERNDDGSLYLRLHSYEGALQNMQLSTVENAAAEDGVDVKYTTMICPHFQLPDGRKVVTASAKARRKMYLAFEAHKLATEQHEARTKQSVRVFIQRKLAEGMEFTELNVKWAVQQACGPFLSKVSLWTQEFMAEFV